MLSVENETLNKASLFLSLYKKACRLHKYSINRLVLYPVILLNGLAMWKFMHTVFFPHKPCQSKVKSKQRNVLLFSKRIS